MRGSSYGEVLDVGKDLIVESKVVGWDDVDTGILLDLPVSKTEALGLSEELLLGDLASPVVLGGLLQVTVDTHAWETEDSAMVRLMEALLLEHLGVTYD